MGYMHYYSIITKTYLLNTLLKFKSRKKKNHQVAEIK